MCVPRGNQEIKRERERKKNGMFHYLMMIMIMVLGIEKYFYSSHIQSLSRAQLFIPNIILTKMNKKKINNVLTRKRARERHANIIIFYFSVPNVLVIHNLSMVVFQLAGWLVGCQVKKKKEQKIWAVNKFSI